MFSVYLRGLNSGAPIRFVQFVPRFVIRCRLYSFIISMILTASIIHILQYLQILHWQHGKTLAMAGSSARSSARIVQTLQTFSTQVEVRLKIFKCQLSDLKTRKSTGTICQIEIHFSSQTSKFLISGRLVIFFTEHDYKVSTSFIKENKRYK